MSAAPASQAKRRPATKRPTARRKNKRRGRKPGTRRQAANRLRRRKILQRVLLSLGAGVVVVGLFVLIPLGLARDPAPICIDDPQTFPEAGIEGWSGEQLDNAATIIRTAGALGFAREGQILGVMTAMGESSLRNIDYGDWETRGFTNPDGSRTTSIGLFQQQGWWGSAEQRMDPATATTLFFDRLGRLPDWQGMEPSHAIHRVQINTDRDYYSRFQADATAVVDAMSGPCE
ncbi:MULTISPECIES: hypothetical protein [unclassified Microbacterium]|uniref:hypothetical protein n=1 Tax=unclassified Microbacterium TaxID=2609290 RepID=UPI000CFC5C07|nr:MULTISPECIES: hypothetical protein [unclassified Microbacterium]PQZ52282.1 hypothetical protein CQ032_17830 [Microbacterium sp. MYb43]PQZ73504.1 hypothetical protein CQ031_17280 [Microbacterium sp. MYb40]PRB16140.1 hypothetical protein CQ040_18635 [Microbacterium sp. MYb54]PRB22581.1 hypothetical protein CQ037_18350 [Microbacterium sp. MYb50]PRB60757.1 hypothetical protein CQ021_18535 [Microbacterium sp. MYb24]